MKNNKLNIQWFTLIEIMISITILSIIMISVLQIYIHSTWVIAKSDVNRILQENIKNVTSHIAEDVRKNWILSVAWTWTKLETNSTSIWYYLTKVDDYTQRIVNVSDCSWIKDICSIVKDWVPLTNTFVAVKDLEFTVTNDLVPKVTMNIIIQPAIWKWVHTNLIKESVIKLQTTISERPF